MYLIRNEIRVIKSKKWSISRGMMLLRKFARVLEERQAKSKPEIYASPSMWTVWRTRANSHAPRSAMTFWFWLIFALAQLSESTARIGELCYEKLHRHVHTRIEELSATEIERGCPLSSTFSQEKYQHSRNISWATTSSKLVDLHRLLTLLSISKFVIIDKDSYCM